MSNFVRRYSRSGLECPTDTVDRRKKEMKKNKKKEKDVGLSAAKSADGDDESVVDDATIAESLGL